VGESGDGFEQGGGKLRVRLAENGPLLLSGNFVIVASSGRIAWQGTEAALCRCGSSGNKPFCDGSHKAVGFKSE
jgi:CDGSH-type Zn-finger protein